MEHAELTVMSYNVYLGGDVGGLLARSTKDVGRQMGRLWTTVQASDWPSRARAIAAEIARVEPDVLSLQEVCRWSTIERDAEGRPGVKVVHDFLETLLAELEQAGMRYFAPVRTWGAVVQLPTPGGPEVRFEDSLAILIKAGGRATDWSKPLQARFSAAMLAGLGNEPFRVTRCWASVDINTQGEVVRVIDTQVEYFDAEVRAAQVHEILQGPASVSKPVVLLGDLNSTPGSEVWNLLARRGFMDAWLLAADGDGATSGQDEDLRNQESGLSERIDWILVRGAIDVSSTWVAGAQDRTPAGLWPSDHAAVAANLTVRVTADAADDPLSVVRTAFKGYMSGDFESVHKVSHPDAVWYFPGDPQILPWAGFWRGDDILGFFEACLGVLDYESYVAHTFTVDGDLVTVLSHERARVKATGRVFRNDLVACVKVRDGKIVSFMEYSDTAVMEAAFLPGAGRLP